MKKSPEIKHLLGAVSFLLGMTACLVSCSSKENFQTQSPSQSVNRTWQSLETSSETLRNSGENPLLTSQVRQAGQKVKRTVQVPRYLSGKLQQSQLEDIARIQGIELLAFDEQKGATYLVTDEQQYDILQQIRKEALYDFNMLIHGQKPMKSLKKLDINSDYSEVKIYVDQAIYATETGHDWSDYFLKASLYQSYACVEEDKKHCKIEVVDEKTQKILSSRTLTEFLKSYR